jgi:regulatory protein
MPARRLPGTANATAPDDPQAARLAAMTLLARRDFTARELTDRLMQRGLEEVAAAGVVAELIRAGVLNDGRYAQNYVAYRAGRGQGPLRIAAELRRSGLAADLIEAALATGPDWSALARKVLRAKFGPQLPDSWAQRARQARFLQYRGFSSDHIRAATGAEPETGFSEP